MGTGWYQRHTRKMPPGRFGTKRFGSKQIDKLVPNKKTKTNRPFGYLKNVQGPEIIFGLVDSSWNRLVSMAYQKNDFEKKGSESSKQVNNNNRTETS